LVDAPPTAAPRRATSTYIATTAVRTADNTLDLRGERVDDALGRLDKFLDDVLARSQDVAYVLHGHGTGALRAAVREHLAGHPAVARFAAAEPAEGGDAVTAVHLR
jgi:DNA mismatch repair protein MutS2